jgi:hypothetical protein
LAEEAGNRDDSEQVELGGFDQQLERGEMPNGPVGGKNGRERQRKVPRDEEANRAGKQQSGGGQNPGLGTAAEASQAVGGEQVKFQRQGD